MIRVIIPTAIRYKGYCLTYILLYSCVIKDIFKKKPSKLPKISVFSRELHFIACMAYDQYHFIFSKLYITHTQSVTKACTIFQYYDCRFKRTPQINNIGCDKLEIDLKIILLIEESNYISCYIYGDPNTGCHKRKFIFVELTA